MKTNTLGTIAAILLIVGGLNWLLAIVNINLVSALFGAGLIANVVYGLVGIAAIYMIVELVR